LRTQKINNHITIFISRRIIRFTSSIGVIQLEPFLFHFQRFIMAAKKKAAKKAAKRKPAKKKAVKAKAKTKKKAKKASKKKK
jgi:hypothetical protein